MSETSNIIYNLNFFEVEPGRKIAYRIYDIENDFEKKDQFLCPPENQESIEKKIKEDMINYEDDYEKIENSTEGFKSEKKILICVHALTRNGSDFDFLARQLVSSRKYIVICPDIAGRGESDYLNQKENYNYEFYSEDLLSFIDFLEIKSCYWLGVSMGGILGMLVNFKRPHLIQKLILNDIAPESPQTTRDQIYNFFLKSYKEYDSYEEISKNLKSSFALFGISQEDHWNFFIKNSIKQNQDRKFIFNYDVEILRSLKEPFKLFDPENAQEYQSTWILGQLISCPLMLIWGKVSSMLTTNIISKFQEFQPEMLLVKVPEAGHAPHMMNKNLIKAVNFWLDSDQILSGEVVVLKS